eukprot:4236982-Alexandrium_andersonii.AAC.1
MTPCVRLQAKMTAPHKVTRPPDVERREVRFCAQSESVQTSIATGSPMMCCSKPYSTVPAKY